MEKLKFLQLTKKERDTSMAQKFINENNTSTVWPDTGQFIFEKNPNELPKYLTIQELVKNLYSYKIALPNVANFEKKLSTIIEDNSEMLVQLEYLARGTDPRDVRDGHIPLMSQLLKCNSSLWNDYRFRFLHFTDTTPLYNLALMTGGLYFDCPLNLTSVAVIFVENNSVKPLCQFFVQLCRDVGLEIPIVYMNPGDIELIWTYFKYAPFLSESTDNIGCTGVIAERSDLDSAIDVFVNSSITAPWRLKQIYVQESIFESFKSALLAKALKPNTGSDYTVGNKTFLVESLFDRAGIPTHAYRTTKELISLVKTPYLSIWAAESALSHEIALLSPSYTVWINDYASFDGPHRSCLSVYNMLFTCSIRMLASTYLNETFNAWTKLRSTERLDLIRTAIKTSNNAEADKLLSDLADWSSDDLIQVTEKSICFGIQKQLGIVTISSLSSFQKAIKLLLNGNAVTADDELRIFDDLVNELKKVGAPIETPIDYSLMLRNNSSQEESVTISTPLLLERLKVVRTNYGTIFAN